MSNAVSQDKMAAPLPEGYPARIPSFSSEEEARQFWDTHDSSYYWDQMEDMTHSPPHGLKRGPGRAGSRARKRPDGAGISTVPIQLHDDALARIKELAEQRQLPYQALLSSWVIRCLEQETERGTTNPEAV